MNRSVVSAAIGNLPWWGLEYRKGPDSALLLTHKHERGGADPFAVCDDVSVVVPTAAKPATCLLVAETSIDTGLPYFVDRFARPRPKEKRTHDRGPLLPAARPNGYADRLPNTGSREKARALVTSVLQDLPGIEAELKPLLRRVARDGKVNVLATNQGSVDLLVNWKCSAEAHGIDVSNTIVFASDDAARDGAQAAGLTVFRRPSLGRMPLSAARAFGDKTFSAMMWMKIVSVWLVSHMGYDLLFQDVDLVWFKDPWEYIDRHHAGDDTVWMDDSARNDRFGPYFANSGFYFLRGNDRGMQWAEETLTQYGFVVQVGSHQMMTSQMLADGHSRYGLNIGIFDPDLFASGAYFHYRMAWMRGALLEGQLPYVFHMCWTTGKTDKVRFLKAVRWWWVDEGATCKKHTASSQGRKAWEEFSRLRLQLDGKTVEARMAEDAKSRRPFVVT